jgi:hypothetical protein
MTCRTEWTFVAVVAVLGTLLAAGAVAEAAENDAESLTLRARAISTLNISRAASDRVEIHVSRWSDESERKTLVQTLLDAGNMALAASLTDQTETGWFRFDPRGGGGPGRDPRKSVLRYARDIVDGNTRELVLLTDQYIGYGPGSRAADGSRLTEYPLSVVLVRLERDDDGEWTGVGRLFVGAKIRYEGSKGRFVVDEFPSDPVYLKDVRLK